VEGSGERLPSEFKGFKTYLWCAASSKKSFRLLQYTHFHDGIFLLKGRNAFLEHMVIKFPLQTGAMSSEVNNWEGVY